jgi:hypothetical protein
MINAREQHMEFKRLEVVTVVLGEKRLVRWGAGEEAGGSMFIEGVDYAVLQRILELLRTGRTAAPDLESVKETQSAADARLASEAVKAPEAVNEGARVEQDESGKEANKKPRASAKLMVKVKGEEKPFADLTMQDMKDGVTSSVTAPRQREPGDDDGDEAPESSSTGEAGDVPDGVRKAGRMLDVVNWCIERGIKEPGAIVAECERLRSAVPFLGRVSDMENRVKRTLAAFHAGA